MRTGIIFVLLLLPVVSFAGAEKKDEPYTFKPMLLDGDDGAGSILGINYGYDRKEEFCEGNQDTGSGFEDPASQLTDKNCFIGFNIEGIWTNDEEINPESFSRTNLDIGYEIVRPDNIDTEKNESINVDFGLQMSIEGDQNYENNQSSVAVQAGALFGSLNKYIAAICSYGEVDASNNDQRKSITNKEKFDRINVEIHLHYPITVSAVKKYSPKSISLNYKYFGEVDAPQEVKDADLDEHKFRTLRLEFENGIFIGYAKGKLPFDFDTKSVLEIGLTHNLF